VSVHSEYSRALEAILDRLRSLDHAQTENWLAMFEAARVGNQADLSSAAREARRLLAIIANDPKAQSVDGLHEPRARLEAHCRAILGA